MRYNDRTMQWPELPLKAWEDTYATLHMWSQVVGKIRMVRTPLVNHWWNVTFYLTDRGFTTSPIPYRDAAFQIDFDFIDHRLLITTDDGRLESIPLLPRTVADFYQMVMQALSRLKIDIKIWTMPVEVQNPIRFEEDQKNRSYEPDYANRFWRIVLETHTIMSEFRSRFIGKCSPVHFFWGSFDLAVTRFSGRAAPPREGADAMTREAYSHEVISHGFWPGMRNVDPASKDVMAFPAFYAYAAPEPEGFHKASIRPAQAFYHPVMKEYFLPYDDVRRSSDPRKMLLDFFQSTYEAGAALGKWDRAALERNPG